MVKTWINITENNDDSYIRTLMRALKTGQFTWIFVEYRAVHLDWQFFFYLFVYEQTRSP